MKLEKKYQSIEHILVIVIPHNTYTLPYSQRQKVINIECID